MKKIFIAICCFILFAGAMLVSASAEVTITDKNGETIVMTDIFAAKTYTDAKGTTLPYRIFVPKEYSTEKEYPVVLFLHGAGQRGTDNESHLKSGLGEPFKDPSSPIYGCIVVAPQCSADSQWVDVKGWSDNKYDSDALPESKCLSCAYELITNLDKEYSVDKNRIYVTGFSMGGFGTWDLIVRHPDTFAAAMPLCGGADYRKASVVKDIPIWTFHGLSDQVVPCGGTMEMVSRLNILDADCKLTAIPDAGHEIWPDIYAKSYVFKWLLQQNLADRQPVADDVSNEETPATEETPQKGCKSAASVAAIPAVACAFGAVAAVKKKED